MPLFSWLSVMKRNVVNLVRVPQRKGLHPGHLLSRGGKKIRGTVWYSCSVVWSSAYLGCLESAVHCSVYCREGWKVSTQVKKKLTQVPKACI